MRAKTHAYASLGNSGLEKCTTHKIKNTDVSLLTTTNIPVKYHGIEPLISQLSRWGLRIVMGCLSKSIQNAWLISIIHVCTTNEGSFKTSASISADNISARHNTIRLHMR